MPRPDQVFHLREMEKDFCYAQANRGHKTLYISGTGSWDDKYNTIGPGDMKTQVRNAYTDIKKTLAAHGLTFEHVVKEGIYVTDMKAFVEALPIRNEFFKGCGEPASLWAEVKRLVADGSMIEVDVTAEFP